MGVRQPSQGMNRPEIGVTLECNIQCCAQLGLLFRVEEQEATPAREVRYLKGTDRPNVITGPVGNTKILKRKNPLDAWEIEGRSFSAEILPPGQSASGFFYFQTPLQHGSSLYVNGLYEAATSKELFYFELPLQ